MNNLPMKQKYENLEIDSVFGPGAGEGTSGESRTRGTKKQLFVFNFFSCVIAQAICT